MAIALGGAVGALLRAGVDLAVPRRAGATFPWGILLVNVTGCLVLGVIVGAVTVRRDVLPPVVRVGLTVGVLGAYTTFSTFAVEAVRLAEAGALGRASAYVLSSVGAGLVAAVVGLAAGAAVVR